MCVPKEKIYNDAPDEFAEFLDSGKLFVSLSDLGGQDNPFIKEGIYKPDEDMFVKYRYTCPKCGEEAYGVDDPDARGLVTLECGINDCAYRFKRPKDSCYYYAIDHMALAEFVSKGIGCSICRQFKKTGWQFGKLREFDVYFACAPTPGMYKALECTPKSILIIGKNTPEMLPASLATKVIYLSRLLYVNEGRLHIAHEAVEEKIPLPRRRGRREEPKTTDEPKKTHSRPPIQVYTPYYLMMIQEWMLKLQKDGKTGRPSVAWIGRWMRQHKPIKDIPFVGDHQIYNHIKALKALDPTPNRPDKRSPSFALYWDGCLDISFINRFSGEDINTLIIKTFKVAEATGFKVRPMRNMDAAEFADKVKQR